MELYKKWNGSRVQNWAMVRNQLEEWDLYENSYNLLQAYKSNLLHVSLRTKEEILREKYEFLKSEYADLFSDFNDLTQQLSENRFVKNTYY